MIFYLGLRDGFVSGRDSFLLHLEEHACDLLLSLDVLVEVKQLSPKLRHLLHLLEQDLVEFLDISFDVAARPVYISEDGHLLLDGLNHDFAVVVVLKDQLLFLFEDLLNQIFVLLAQLVYVVDVLILQLIERGNSISELLRASWDHRCRLSLLQLLRELPLEPPRLVLVSKRGLARLRQNLRLRNRLLRDAIFDHRGKEVHFLGAWLCNLLVVQDILRDSTVFCGLGSVLNAFLPGHSCFGIGVTTRLLQQLLLEAHGLALLLVILNIVEVWPGDP